MHTYKIVHIVKLQRLAHRNHKVCCNHCPCPMKCLTNAVWMSLQTCPSLQMDMIVTFVDWLSKYVYFVACKHDLSAEQLANIFLATVVVQHRMPRCLISDHDPRFTSRFWKALTGVMGCKLNMSTAYHPQTDGQTEHFNRSIE